MGKSKTREPGVTISYSKIISKINNVFIIGVINIFIINIISIVIVVINVIVIICQVQQLCFH